MWFVSFAELKQISEWLIQQICRLSERTSSDHQMKCFSFLTVDTLLKNGPVGDLILLYQRLVDPGGIEPRVAIV